MTTTALPQSTPVSAGDRLRSLAGAALNRLMVTWRTMRNRRSVSRLLEWDEYMLRDIGVTSGDVRSALASPMSDDPSYRLGAMSSERREAFRARAEERLLVRHGVHRVRSKSETLADAHRHKRRVTPRPVLEL